MRFSNTADNFRLNAVPDTPDSRDLYYQPALIAVSDEIKPPGDLEILDQGTEGACTGFGLAATINFLNQVKRKRTRVSARMLYEMARKFDEWEGDEYAGSSCRGAMRGWQNMGVCDEQYWPYKNKDKSELTAKQATKARENTPGAYYRLAHRVEDFHVALNEVGILYVSATVHKGWYSENLEKNSETSDIEIPFLNEVIGGHAFSVVGYNARGFWVQNSWNEAWGNRGLALWLYEDWRENISDAWVVRLAAPTPQLWASRSFRGEIKQSEVGKSEFGLFKSPKRHEIKGHFVHIDDGKFHTKGRYFSSLADVKETATILQSSEYYKHVVLYAHGGLNNPKASAERIAAMKNTFTENGIYPYHFMYDTGLLEELKDIVLKCRSDDIGNRAEGLWQNIVERWDRKVENTTRKPGRAFWREMKRGAILPFETSNRAGSETLTALLSNLNHDIKIHIVGHSTGAILMAHLLERLSNIRPELKVATCSLMAPACTRKDFETFYKPLLNSNIGAFGIKQMTVYNLIIRLELDDTVTPAYRKSLLYLVSNAFEEKRPESLLGLQKFSKMIEEDNLELVYSSGGNSNSTRTGSTSHGGFDNDPHTMNDILKRVLGVNELPIQHFTKKNLDY